METEIQWDADDLTSSFNRVQENVMNKLILKIWKNNRKYWLNSHIKVNKHMWEVGGEGEG